MIRLAIIAIILCIGAKAAFAVADLGAKLEERRQSILIGARA